MKHVVQFSTGAGSAEVAYRVVAEQGEENTVLLTADTLVEDGDNWRFAAEVVNHLGCEWIKLVDGRTPMEVGRDHKAVPSNRWAICSRVLKRELLRRYINENFTPDDSVHYLGFDWTEPDRHDKSIEHWAPYRIESPLIAPPYVSKPDLLNHFREVRGIEPPHLYKQGFKHANCAGACVRGGQAQWELLLRVNRTLYLEWEGEEEKTRSVLGKDVSILRDRSDAVVSGAIKSGRVGAESNSVPLTLGEFRSRLDAQPSLFDIEDHGACGCTDTFAGEDTTGDVELITRRGTVWRWTERAFEQVA